MSETRVPDRLILALDTATPSVVAGVVRLTADGQRQTPAQRVIDDHRRHAEVLTTLIREVLADAGATGADLDAVVVGCGPGPFTGLRVGMATAAAYADALDLPVHGVCSLDAIAAAVTESSEVLVVTDARRREAYWARYSGGERVAGPEVSEPGDVDPGGAAVVAGTPGFTDRYGLPVAAATVPTPASLVAAYLSTSSRGDLARARGDLARARGDLARARGDAPLVPLYLRRPDAVELKDQRRKSLL
ncbi:tRNA (adenosine(37)-N6)-threonylcarbamoyltransferase complex dimerization subunit type 1 TsaB [Gordonia iterans]